MREAGALHGASAPRIRREYFSAYGEASRTYRAAAAAPAPAAPAPA